MLIQGATAQEIEEAAAEAGVRLAYLDPAPHHNPVFGGFRTVLRTANPEYPNRPRTRPKYQRLSQREYIHRGGKLKGQPYHKTVPGRVCWHGHRDFLRALYLRAPSAVVKTTLITYRGQGHFEAAHQATGHAAGTGGYYGFGLAPDQACTCPEGS